MQKTMRVSLALLVLSISDLHAENQYFGPFVSVQVNVDSSGNNIQGDEANTPSIAVDPNDPSRIVVGWRDIHAGPPDRPGCFGPPFDRPCLRRNAFSYSHDGGASWSPADVIEPDQDRTLPVLAADAAGNFYYQSLRAGESWLPYSSSIFKSSDGGQSWNLQGISPTVEEYNLEPWMVVAPDQTLYVSAGRGIQRSVDEGQSFELIDFGEDAAISTIDVGPTGLVWTAERTGNTYLVNENLVDQTGDLSACADIQPDYWNDRLWLVADPFYENRAYILVKTTSGDLSFQYTSNGGESWSHRIKINDDGDFVFYGMMSIAPNGRLDVVWQREYWVDQYWFGEIRYSFSLDRGLTWSDSIQISPALNWGGESCTEECGFGSHYHNHLASTNDAAHVVYAEKFNLPEWSLYFYEWDIFYVRVPMAPLDWDQDGLQNQVDDDDDNDGVGDLSDQCPLTVVGVPVFPSGRSLGDQNGNCCTDLIDFNHYGVCQSLSGPGDVTFPASCREYYDLDFDLDQDLGDFSVFQVAFSPTGCRPFLPCQ